jgi:hypothetical protein
VIVTIADTTANRAVRPNRTVGLGMARFMTDSPWF